MYLKKVSTWIISQVVFYKAILGSRCDNLLLLAFD